MDALLEAILKDRALLLVVAAPVEARACLRVFFDDHLPAPAIWGMVRITPNVHLLHCGVSKANAAGGVARALALAPGHYGAVLNVGIAGSLPSLGEGQPQPRVTTVIASTSCIFGDEGIVTNAGYQDVAGMGFPIDTDGGMSFPCDPRLVRCFEACVDHVGPIATVSTCSGTDALAQEIARRTGALAESMEGAAVALAAKRAGVPMIEVRAISNLTGDRAAQAWDIDGALARLERVLSRVLG